MSTTVHGDRDVEREAANRGHGDFRIDELRYSRTARCPCGAALAYPRDIGMHGSWYCSAILRGVAGEGKTHTRPKTE